MSIRIAIPEPTSTDAEYNARSLPAYIAALQSSGAVPIVVPLHELQDRVARLLAGTHGVLLPGSKFDVDPERYAKRGWRSAERQIRGGRRWMNCCCRMPSICASRFSASVMGPRP